MGPKIEAIESKPRVEGNREKNPFERKQKKVTIKREAKEIYPLKDGKLNLNKPNYVSNLPLDQLFLKVEKQLDGSIDEATVEKLYDKLYEGNGSDVGCNMRYKVIEMLLHYLHDIQRLSNEVSFDEDEHLIRISLHDMRTLSKILNLVIVIGMYPALKDFNIGIPLSKRTLNEYSKTRKSITVASLHGSGNGTSEKDYSENERLLKLIYDSFLQIFTTESNVKDLLLRGTGFSDFLTIALALASVPHFDQAIRRQVSSDLDAIILQIPDTYELFQTFSLLMSSRSPPYFKKLVFERLETLHYNAPKGDGVLVLIEFVLGLREHEEVGIEKFDNIANVILAKPKSIGVTDYFTVIGAQFFKLLVNINRPDVTSCVTYVIERLWRKNKLVARDFFFKRIHSIFNPTGDREVLSSEAELNNGINVILSLTKKSLALDLYQELISPILLQLWAYLVFCASNNKSTGVMIEILFNYLLTYASENLQSDDIEIQLMAKNLMYEGESTWEFMIGNNNMVQIVKKTPMARNESDIHEKTNKFVNNLDIACECFINILKRLEDETIVHISSFVLKGWLKKDNENSIGDKNPYLVLSDLKLLEKLMDRFKDTVAKTPTSMLALIQNYLESTYSESIQFEHNPIHVLKSEVEEDSDDEEAVDQNYDSSAVETILELLGAILAEPSFKLDKASTELLRSISQQLKTIQSAPALDKSLRDMAGLLLTRIASVTNGSEVKKSSDYDSKILERAMISLNDSLIPVRAHGLYLLRSLIQNNSSVVSSDYAIKLHLAQLEDPEPFVYLNVIKGLEELLNMDEEHVLNSLLVLYSKESSTFTLDKRLKIGEVLLRYIQRSNEMFSGDSALLICKTMLEIVRRRETKEDDYDIELRVSALSLLGTCYRINPKGIVEELDHAVDCALGVLKLETNDNETNLRRAAIISLHDIFWGLSKAGLNFHYKLRSEVLQTLKYICTTDNDLLVTDQARDVIDDIQDVEFQNVNT